MQALAEDLDTFIRGGLPLARIDIVSAKGSVPREQGTWMLVAKDRCFLTIGGGQLEYLAIDEARKLIASGNNQPKKIGVPLGPQIGQCCGGNVEVLVRLCDAKLLDASREQIEAEINAWPDVYVFGAGHVGKAISKALTLLPVKTLLVDTRKAELTDLPIGVEARHVSIPEAEVRSAEPGSAFVILTHDHSMDFLIASEALARKDAAYVGMIGSKTKRATFGSWSETDDSATSDIERLVCPIGGNQVKDKRPEVIAALVVAEVVTALDGLSGASRTDAPRTVENQEHGKPASETIKPARSQRKVYS